MICVTVTEGTGIYGSAGLVTLLFGSSMVTVVIELKLWVSFNYSDTEGDYLTFEEISYMGHLVASLHTVIKAEAKFGLFYISHRVRLLSFSLSQSTGRG